MRRWFHVVCTRMQNKKKCNQDHRLIKHTPFTAQINKVNLSLFTTSMRPKDNWRYSHIVLLHSLARPHSRSVTSDYSIFFFSELFFTFDVDSKLNFAFERKSTLTFALFLSELPASKADLVRKLIFLRFGELFSFSTCVSNSARWLTEVSDEVVKILWKVENFGGNSVENFLEFSLLAVSSWRFRWKFEQSSSI